MKTLREMVDIARGQIAKDLIEAATDDARRQLNVRLEYVKSIAIDPVDDGPMKVFVSYHKKRAKIFQALKEELETVSKFEVRSGFDDVPRARNVIDNILARLRPCSIYVGILTPDMRTKGAGRATAPSPWTIAEEGMAIALGKDYVLMIHERVEKEVWARIDPSQKYIPFNDKSIVKAIGKVRETVDGIRDDLIQRRAI